jgi:hypothetical protein
MHALTHVPAVAAARPRFLLLLVLAGGAAAQSPEPASAPDSKGARTSGFLVDAAPLFEALHADPRWPHFGASFQYYSAAQELQQVAAVSLGETLSIYRDARRASRWEAGLQGGVFAIFDLDASSNDLVNADYRVAPTLSWQRESVSAQLRLYHQSSHLGDEFLLRTPITRVNLSYEVTDLLLSFDATEALRCYAGGGYVVRSEPNLERWLTQAGVEFTGPGRAGLRPVGAIDLQSREEHDWQLDCSVRAGIALDGALAGNRRLQIMLEYYHGRSPNGQFYVDDVEFVGIGLHFYF